MTNAELYGKELNCLARYSNGVCSLQGTVTKTSKESDSISGRLSMEKGVKADRNQLRPTRERVSERE